MGRRGEEGSRQRGKGIDTRREDRGMVKGKDWRGDVDKGEEKNRIRRREGRGG